MSGRHQPLNGADSERRTVAQAIREHVARWLPATRPYDRWMPPAPPVINLADLRPDDVGRAYRNATLERMHLADDAERGIRRRSVTVRAALAFDDWPPAVRP